VGSPSLSVSMYKITVLVLIHVSVRGEDSGSDETDSAPSAAVAAGAGVVSGSEIGDRLSRLTGGGMSKMSSADGAWCGAVGGEGPVSTGTAMWMLSAIVVSDVISDMPTDALSRLTGGAI
jgi:hypothetical protein